MRKTLMRSCVALWVNAWRFTGCFHSEAEGGAGGGCAFDAALFIYKAWLREKKEESCFPESNNGDSV